MKTWVIESRDETGQLDLKGQQPENVFGLKAITGIDENEMADVIFRHKPNAQLTGFTIPIWPRLIDSRFVARVKTW